MLTFADEMIKRTPKRMDKKSICCIGHVTRDHIVTPTIDAYCAGGTAYYVAWALQRLTTDFSIVTAVSREVMPEVVRMRAAGISVTAFDSPENVFFENRYGRNMDNRTQRVLAKSAPFTVGQMEQVEAQVFHLGTLLADDFAPEVVEYLATKGDVSIDVQGYMRYVDGQQVRSCDWSDKLRLLRHTAILKVNEHEFHSLTGLDEPHAAAEQISEWGVREVIITLGGGGSLIYAGGRFYETPAFPPRRLVDATGCGDTYSAGYLYCRSQGMDYAESGRFAAAMCTLKLGQTGPFCQSLKDIERVMRSE